MFLNLNVGVLGHVDSGKTTLAQVLSEISSTAAFDKHPQSQERGITLDLGFSALATSIPAHFQQQLQQQELHYENLLLTFVDCPGHSSLIRTIIGGAQIIDAVLLVVDVQKGIQTQTAECLVISEITSNNLMVVINKIDLIDEAVRETTIKKLESKIRKALRSTKFGSNVPIISLSALKRINIEQFLEKFKKCINFPQRNYYSKPFLFCFDHCFSIKGKGIIFTGTVLQGTISVNDNIEIPSCKEQRKIKSIQMFHKAIEKAGQGDRIGICVSQLNSSISERGFLCEVGLVKKIFATVININKVKYYKYPIKSKAKFHITGGHETVMGKITLFRDCNQTSEKFDLLKNYEYVDEYDRNGDEDNKIHSIFALIEFETPILSTLDSLLIGSKLDIDNTSNICRIAFHGRMQWINSSSNGLDLMKQLSKLKIYKEKFKKGYIQRIVNNNEVIVENLFKKESKREVFIGKKINLSSGEEGFIEGTFGQTTKVKVRIPNGLEQTTIEKVKCRNNDIVVSLRYKTFIFNKNHLIFQ